MRYVWDKSSWEDYVYWQTTDQKVAKRIDVLLRDIARGADASTPNEGIGKPKQLKHRLHGYRSRRITDEHRLVYKVVDDEVRIAMGRFHYED